MSKDSESRWRTALEAVADGVWDWDLRTGETFFSPPSLALWGYDPHGPTPRADEIFKRVHPDDLLALKNEIEAYLSGGADRFEREFRVVDPTGATHWVLGRGCVVDRDEEGRPTRMLGTNVDITARKKAESRLLRQQAQMGAAQELARVGYWTYDVATQQPSWSEMMFEILGCDPEQGIPTFEEHRNFIHPDDWDRFQEAVEGAIEGRPYDCELRVLFPDGSRHYVRARGYPESRVDGQVKSLFGVTQDITTARRREDSLREQEALFRSTFEQAAVGMVQSDTNGKWLRVNERFCELLGYTLKELMRLDFSAVTHPDDRSRSYEHLQRVLRTRDGGETWRKRYIRKDGSLIWAQLTGSAVRDRDGTPLYYLGIVVDISSRVEAEHQLQESRNRLRALNEQLEQVREDERALLAREIHDDLGQHLTAVRMDLSRLASEYGHLSSDLEENVRELGAFVEQGIQIARNISSGLQSPVLELLGFVEAVRSTAEELSGRFGFALDLDLPPREPGISKRQKATLYAIVKEALANASSHSKAETVRVVIRMDAGVLSAAVQDDGVGIPVDVLEDPRSFGVLTMMERARSMGAEFSVDRRPEGGTIVRVVLPGAEGT